MAESTPLTLEKAYLELLDHVDELVTVGIMLPGAVPWAGGHGTLSHQVHKLMNELDDESGLRRRWAELLLQRGGREGLFMVGDFVVPLDAEKVVAVQRAVVGLHPVLDFAIVGGLTVHVTFLEHASEGGES